MLVIKHDDCGSRMIDKRDPNHQYHVLASQNSTDSDMETAEEETSEDFESQIGHFQGQNAGWQSIGVGHTRIGVLVGFDSLIGRPACNLLRSTILDQANSFHLTCLLSHRDLNHATIVSDGVCFGPHIVLANLIKPFTVHMIRKSKHGTC